MTMLSREAILAAPDLKTEVVEVAEWGGSVTVSEMNGTARDAYEQSMISTETDGVRKADMRNMRAKLLAMTLVDENGELLFGAAQVDELGTKSGAVLDRLFDVAQRLNSLGAAAVGDAVKNSDAAPSGASTSV